VGRPAPAAFLNDRYVDPACVCNTFVANAQEETAFLTACFGAPPTDHQRARVFVMRQACHMFFAAIMIRMAAAERPGWQLPDGALATPPLLEVRRKLHELVKTPEGKAHVALATLNEVLANTRSLRFSEALAMLRRPV
jgi:hypothetical protein